MTDADKKIQQVIEDKTASPWLKGGLMKAMALDPKDAEADAGTLHWLLKMRWEDMQKAGRMG